MEYFKEKIGEVDYIQVKIIRATLSEAEEFKNLLIAEIDAGNKKIVVDLSACEFIDSTFLGTLVVALKKLTALEGDLRLIGFQPAVHSMFELTRMYRVFESFKSKEEAIKSFS
jgi:anti-anti-sigma factor